MSNSVVILLDDDKKIHDTFHGLISDMEIDIEIASCHNIEEYENTLRGVKKNQALKSIIFDLSNNDTENDSKIFAISQYITQEFEESRIPIFIHSAYLENFTDFEDMGTVYKIKKSKDSIGEICEKLQLFNDSEFLDIFCSGGKLENKLMREIHSAFVSQFKKNEIEGIIKSIKSNTNGNMQERTTEVFERIAIKSVYQNVISAKRVEDQIQEVKVNSIEHYYRRVSDFRVWTGDIFKSNSSNEFVIVLTPRCNVGHENYNELILCQIKLLNDQKLKEVGNAKKGVKRLQSGITDNMIGDRLRFLPKTPQFIGGEVDFVTVFSMNKDEFLSKYAYHISLVDDLTNDIVRKFSAYLLRGGISETEYNEAHYYYSKSDKETVKD